MNALLQAADLIEKQGWCQGDYESDNGQVCILGALRFVIAGSTDVVALQQSPKYKDYVLCTDQISAALHGKLPHQWNDERDRTKDEVVALLREVGNASNQ